VGGPSFDLVFKRASNIPAFHPDRCCNVH
jgi:hypothetical protein